MTHPIGVISIGSNDIHLLVATSDGATTLTTVADRSIQVELVDALHAGALPDAVLAQTRRDIDALVVHARAAGARTVIAGAEEAALDYCWATFPPAPDYPALVVDSSGGSTQALLVARPQRKKPTGRVHAPAYATSLPIGAGNLTARYLPHDPPRVAEIAALTAAVDALVHPLPAEPAPVAAVLIGGSADALLKLTTAPTRGVLTGGDLDRIAQVVHQDTAAAVARSYDLPVVRARARGGRLRPVAPAGTLRPPGGAGQARRDPRRPGGELCARPGRLAGRAERRGPTTMTATRARPRTRSGEMMTAPRERRGTAPARRLGAELLGTWALTTVAAGGAMIGALSGGEVSPSVRVVAPALLVMALIYVLGPLSGAHFNPAVTLAFALRRDFPWRRVPGYWAVQVGGAVLAVLLLRALLGPVGDLGATRPHHGLTAAVGMEVVLTGLLLTVILGTATDHHIVGHNAALAVGATIALDGLFAAPISGASMNPARSLGPVLVSGQLGEAWIYVVGPFLGALVAVGGAWLLRGGTTPDAVAAASGDGPGGR